MKKTYEIPQTKSLKPLSNELMGSGLVGSEQTSNPEDWNANEGFLDTEDANRDKDSQKSFNVWERTL